MVYSVLGQKVKKRKIGDKDVEMCLSDAMGSLKQNYNTKAHEVNKEIINR